jgi:acetyltransferase-like isoleucine patch superfamily enzyme
VVKQTVQVTGALKTRFQLLVVKFQRLRELGIIDVLLGFWLQKRFTRASKLVVTPGWPLPKIINYGGHVEATGCRFSSGVRLECWKNGLLKIGNGTYLNRGAEIVASKSVRIGASCRIARDVVIMDTDQHAVDDSGVKMHPVNIEDRVWLGCRATILKGVSIGHDSIIGAGAIVTKSIPPHSIVVGPEARIIKRTDGVAKVNDHGGVSFDGSPAAQVQRVAVVGRENQKSLARRS